MKQVQRLVAKARLMIFDLDGTLVNTFDDLHLSLASALQAHQLPEVSHERLMIHIHQGLDTTIRSLLKELDSASVETDAVIATYRRHYREREHAASRLYPGVKNFLEACRRRGVFMAICTNKLTEDALSLIEVHDIYNYFIKIVGIDSTSHAKPDPAPLQLILTDLKCSPAQAVFVGDSVIDAECARRAEVPFLLHREGFGSEEALAFGYCEGHFQHFDELVLKTEITT